MKLFGFPAKNFLLSAFTFMILSGIFLNKLSAETSIKFQCLKNDYLEIRFESERNYIFKVYLPQQNQPILAHQTLEMPEINAREKKCTYEYKSKLVGIPKYSKNNGSSSIRVIQDWPLFEVEKTVTLADKEPQFKLKYVLKVKENIKLTGEFPIWSYFFAGPDVDRIGWKTPKGMVFKVREKRKKIHGTSARGSEHGRFAAFQEGEKGPALIIASPCKAQRNKFNIWRYERPRKDGSESVTVGFKSKIFNFTGSLKKGDTYVSEWILRLAENGNIQNAVTRLFDDYHRNRSKIAAMKNMLTIPRLNRKPKFSGKIDDPIWQKASTTAGFTFPNGGFPENQTTVHIFAANRSLFIGFKCMDSDIKNIRKRFENHDDPVWKDDCVEVFLANDNNSTKYFHFLCNALGTRYDEKCDNWGEGQVIHDNTWNGSWRVKTNINEKEHFWSVEIEIPLKTLGLSLDNLKSLRLNLTRSHHKDSNTCWSPTYGSFHNIERFGKALVVSEGESLCVNEISEDEDNYLCRFEVGNNSDNEKTFYLFLTPVDNNNQDGYSFQKEFSLAPKQHIRFNIPFRHLLRERCKNRLVADSGV